jgi:hypothetical protein
MSGKKMPQEFAGRRGGGPEKPDPNRIISMKLKALFEAVEEEGIPERFLNLLERLDEAERKQSAESESDE